MISPRSLQDRAPARIQASMLALTDSQLRLVMDASRSLSPEKRSLFLERVAAWLKLYGASDLKEAIQSALSGLRS